MSAPGTPVFINSRGEYGSLLDLRAQRGDPNADDDGVESGNAHVGGGNNQHDSNSNDQHIPVYRGSLGNWLTTSASNSIRNLAHTGSLRMSAMRSSVRHSVRDFVNASFVLHGKQCSVRDFDGNATIISEILNISKNLVGAGVLSLSGGLAMYSNSPYAILSGTFWVVVLGAIFGYFCWIIAKVCQITRSATYRECWEETVGESGAMAISFVNAMKPALGNLAYSIILSQSFSSLTETAGWKVDRIPCLLIITVFALLPLCLLKNLNVLAPFSVLGTLGILSTAVALWIRYLDGSYAPGGAYYDKSELPLLPDLAGDRTGSFVRLLPFLCMVFEAYVMHYNSPRFYTELKNATLPRFGLAVSGSFGLSAVIYALITAAGFLTFGGSSDGYILNSYSPRDPLAALCRFLIALSTLLTFPIVFIGFRDGVLDVLDVPPELQTSENLNVLTVFLLSIITVIAIFCTDLGVLNAVGGGTLGTAVVFIFPALMYHNAVHKCLKDRATAYQKREVVFVNALMVFGIILGAIGVVESVK